MKTFKYLRAYILPLLLTVVCLVVQAYCDLSLPQYMSNIVNIGIQQGGIDSTVPQTVEKTDFEKILIFTQKDTESLISSAYSETEENGRQVYSLRSDITDEDYAELKDAMRMPLLSTMLFEQISSGADSEMLPDELTSMIPDGTDIFTMLAALPEEQRLATVAQISEQLSGLEDLGDSTVDQMTVMYISQLYKNAGADTAKIQNDYILRAGFIMIIYTVFLTVSNIFVSLLASLIGSGFSRDLRRGIYEKVMSFSNKELDSFGTSSLITRCTNDIMQVQMTLIMALRMVLYAPIIGVGALIKVTGSGAGMTWIIALALVLILGFVFLLMSVVMPRFTKLQKLIDRVNLVSREILTGLPVIRAFSREKFESERFDGANTALYKTNLFVNRIMSCMMPVMMLFMNGINVLIIYVGASKIDSGSMQVGDLMAFMQYTMQIIISFLMLSAMSIMLPRALVSVRRINDVLKSENSIHDPSETERKSFKDDMKGVVEFRDVYFAYPDANEAVLRNISFVAESGKTTAFIGSTGSGKSTLINLIPRFFDVTGGKILVDGVNIKNVALHDLREKIGYVPQKGLLFSGTIGSNIAFDEKNISQDEIEWAAQIAQASEFISEKPDGYDSEIAQGGTNVSGGQRQRLSIARAIAKKPEILIFDDSFSALDFKTDLNLRKALKKATAESTVLIVAQRISTVMHADRIIVLDNGEIVGMGTHPELLENCEIYRQIAESQLSKEEMK